MAIFVNNVEADNVYFGEKQLDHVYVNEVMVYESTVYIDKPTVTGAYTFNNATQAAVISNYDSSQVTLEGTTSAKSAGTYAVKFTPKKGYAWKDGTTSTVSYTWTIAKRSITIPSLSATSFTWVEGTTHSVVVKNLDTSYVSQSGTLSQTDASSNLDKSNTVTWTLKYPSDTKWTDNTSANKTASWSSKWVNGTSHYKNDLYNRGWNSGLLGFMKYKTTDTDIDWGGASKPYITKKNVVSTSDHLSIIYYNNTNYLLKTKWEYEFVGDTAYCKAKAVATYIDELGKTGSSSKREYGNSEAASEEVRGTVYGNKTGDSTYWPTDLTKLCPAFNVPTAGQTAHPTLECHITRVYHD